MFFLNSKISFSFSEILRFIDFARSCDPNETTLTLSLKEQISSKLASPLMLSKLVSHQFLNFHFFKNIINFF